jgi:hypothetical protein
VINSIGVPQLCELAWLAIVLRALYIRSDSSALQQCMYAAAHVLAGSWVVRKLRQ